MTNKALDTQIGGTHYKDMAIQPLEYIVANKLSFCEGNVVKYVSRWRNKNGIEDLRKARQYIDMLIEQAVDPTMDEEEMIEWLHREIPEDILCKGNR